MFFFLSVQQHMQQQWVHVPEPSVYPQALCVWPWQRLQRWLRWVPGVWWVEQWPLIPDGAILLLSPAFNELNSPSTWCCFSLQNILHVDPMSSAVPMDAVSSRVHGSVMETSTAMINQTKPPRTHTAMAQVRSPQPLQRHFTFTYFFFYLFIYIYRYINWHQCYVNVPDLATCLIFICAVISLATGKAFSTVVTEINSWGSEIISAALVDIFS